MSNTTWNDDRGQRLDVGDTVAVVHIDRDHGAHLWMDRGTVVGFARTRVRVLFPSRTKAQAVAPTALRKVGAAVQILHRFRPMLCEMEYELAKLRAILAEAEPET